MNDEALADRPIAIRLIDLHKSFGGVHAVRGLTISVPSGSFFGFLGPNGAGKTTTIRLLMGLMEPSSGTIEVLGLRLPQDSLAIRRHLGLVPEDTLLFDQLTGDEYLQFIGRLYGLSRQIARDRARELLALFELDEKPRLLAGEYSKGMRKRLAVAAALIHEPKLFVLDEPFEGIDAIGARLIKEILQDQVSRGNTVFLTSHVLEVVERLCDHVAIIDRGRAVAQGSMSDLQLTNGAGRASLEEIFVRVVGAEPAAARLSWLGKV